MKIEFQDAVNVLASGVTFTHRDGIIEEWDINNTNIPQPSQADIDAKIIELEAEWTANQYQRDRASSYPSVGDQLDMLMKDMKNGTTTHQEACEAVKAQFPKP